MEQQDGIDRVQEDIKEMVACRFQAEQIASQNIGKPRQRVPNCRFKGSKGPTDGFQRLKPCWTWALPTI